jgi:putative component of membrane protein insertase Oxa1/YidC/SpoIIIJ protein YidD
MVFNLLFIFAAIGYAPPWGKDADVHLPAPKPYERLASRNPLSSVAEQVILFHQNVLSPVDGPRSHFRPTSSRYMLLAIRRYGFVKGYIMGCDRLLRENSDPWVYPTRIINGVEWKWDPP